MGLFRRQAPATEAPRKSLMAAAVDLNESPATWRARTGEDLWQKDAWKFYDAVGELRFATNWLANAVSMADMYVAEIDPATGLITGPTDNARAQAVLGSMFGGAAKRSQAQKTMALNYVVAGEFFTLIRSRPNQDDEWVVLSSTEVTERSGEFTYNDPLSGRKIPVNPNADLLLRTWEPHPRCQTHADSCVRAALPILKEIERTSMNIAARLDSRLSGAGVWIIPKEMDFAGGDNTPEGPQGVMQELIRAASASLSNPGQASAQVPIILEAPGEQVPNFSFQTFATELTAEILELRPAAIRRLAVTMDMPMEIIEGMENANHWSAWQIEEGGYKIHVAPLLDRIADSLTTHYLQGALAAAGVPNPERYVIDFDVTKVVSRPNRQAELLELHDRILVSDEAMRQEAGVPDSEIPDEQEHNRRFVEKLVLQDSSLLADPGVRQILGLGDITVSQPSETVSQLPPAEEPSSDRALPERVSQSDEGLTAAAELMVFDALSRAGGRMLTREHRGQHGSTPKHELYRIIPGEPDSTKLLEGSFQFASGVAPMFGFDADLLEENLRQYCSMLLGTRRSYDRQEMKRWLSL